MRVIIAARSLHTTASIYGRGVKFDAHLNAVERRKWRFVVRIYIRSSDSEPPIGSIYIVRLGSTES